MRLSWIRVNPVNESSRVCTSVCSSAVTIAEAHQAGLLPTTSERAMPNRDNETLWGVSHSRSPRPKTARRVHRLPAILLRRWQAEEIAKTPLPCVSRIRTKIRPRMNQLKSIVGDRINKTDAICRRRARSRLLPCEIVGPTSQISANRH